MRSIIGLLSGVILIFSSVCAAELIEIGDQNLWIMSHGSLTDVPLIITDPQGRRFGYDPRSDQWIEEFVGSYEPAAGGIDEISEEFKNDLQFNIVLGDYVIEAVGKELETFRLSASISRGRDFVSFDFNGVTDKGLISKFKVTYNGPQSNIVGTGVRISTQSSLKQDITLSRKVGWIDNDGIMNSLLKKADAAESAIAKGNKEAAKNQLNALVNEFNAQKDKHISNEAVKMLLEDVQYIIEQLK